MNDPGRTIAKGTVFIVTEGEFSEYVVVGAFRALRDFSPSEEAALITPIEKEESDEWYCRIEKFIPQLIRLGIVEEVDCERLHLGSYGELDPG